MTKAASLTEQAQWATVLMQARQTILPKHLGSPGPNDVELQALLSAAACAPDHGRLLPWRFIWVPIDARERLAQVFAEALLKRDASALPEQVAQARAKAHRAPLLLLLVVNGQCGDPEIDLNERIVSAGCAVQNLLLMATALGFASALTSGKALKAVSLRKLFDLAGADHALCFVNVGTTRTRKPARQRPVPADYVRCLSPCENTRLSVYPG